MSKPKIYFILGAAGSGRRQVLADLVADDLASGTKVACLLAQGEAASAWDQRCGQLERWTFTAEHKLAARLPEGATEVFLLFDGRRNPVDQLEAAQEWLRHSGGELARIFCVVHCRLAEKHPALLAWYDACIHFSDVVLLHQREGVSNKWITEFRARYEKQFYPCLFEFVKDGRVKNPALLLDPVARRIAQVFDEDWAAALPADVVIEDDADEEESDDAEGDDEEDLLPEPDPYFARRLGGRRVREIPNIADYLEAPSAS